MNTEYLKTIAEEIALKKEHSGDTGKPDHHLANEAKRLEKEITHSLTSIENFTQRDTFHFNTLSKLINICDMLFEIDQKISPDVLVIADLIDAIKQVIPNEIRPNLKLPKAFLVTQQAVLSESWLHHEKLMEANDIDGKLITIAAIPFNRFIELKLKLYWGDFTWLKGYQAKLDIMDWDNADCNSRTEALMSLLIGRDFNDDRFYIYCKKYIQERTKTVNGKRNRLLEFAECEKLILEDTQIGMAPFDPRANTVSSRLIKWVREEIDFVETNERDQPVSKFEFKWNVETIAFFFKLLHERKVFGKIFLEPFAEQIAANCSSIGKEEFQATTIHSRFYVKDLEVVKYIEKLLLEMLEAVTIYLK